MKRKFPKEKDRQDLLTGETEIPNLEEEFSFKDKAGRQNSLKNASEGVFYLQN